MVYIANSVRVLGIYISLTIQTFHDIVAVVVQAEVVAEVDEVKNVEDNSLVNYILLLVVHWGMVQSTLVHFDGDW